MSVINLRENKEPPISGQHFVCGKFGSSLGQLICFCGDGEIAQARSIGVHTVDHRWITIPPQKEILNFMMLLNVNITFESTHEMPGACTLTFMTRLVLLPRTGGPQKNPLWGPNPITAETDKTGAYLATSHWLHENSIPTTGHGQKSRFSLPKSMIAPLDLGSNLK
jgi:hypothetical protein